MFLAPRDDKLQKTKDETFPNLFNNGIQVGGNVYLTGLTNSGTNDLVYYDQATGLLSYDVNPNPTPVSPQFFSGTFSLTGTVSGSITWNLVNLAGMKILILSPATIQKNASAGQITTNAVTQLIPTFGTPEVLFSCLEIAGSQVIYGVNINSLGVVTIFKSQVVSRNIPANQSFITQQTQIVYF